MYVYFYQMFWICAVLKHASEYNWVVLSVNKKMLLTTQCFFTDKTRNLCKSNNYER